MGVAGEQGDAGATLPRRGLFRGLDTGSGAIALTILAGALLVFPPFFYLIESSVTVPLPGFKSAIGWDNYRRVLELGGSQVWSASIAFAAGSTIIAVVLGFTIAWLVARTNAPFRQTVFIGAFLSMSVPLIVKGIGWILLLGPNNGIVNLWLRSWFGLDEAPINLFSLEGMILVEGLLWTPVAFLLALPPLVAMDPSLEEAAAMAGATRWQVFARVTLPLARPSMLAVLLLSFIRALESFEVPLLIGTPGGVVTLTTALYQSIHSGFLPRYGDASAYAVLLVAAVALPLYLYYRATKDSGRFATVSGTAFRPARLDLGLWRIPSGAVMLIVPVSLGAPMLVMLWSSFLPIYVSPSLQDLGRMSLANYTGLWARPDTLAGIGNSLLVGAASATFVALATLVMSWLVVRRREPIRFAIDVIASLPLVFPGIVLGIAVLVEFLNLRWIPIYGTIWIVMLAFIVKFLPYGMRFNYSGIHTIGRELEEAARSCGASTFGVLRYIVLPLAMPAVWATWVYVFIYAIRDLATAVLLSGPRSPLVSVVILDLWNNGEVSQLAALSVIIAAGGAVLGFVFMRLSQRHGFKA
jgi:iron(III) transport system permease protein